MTLMTLPTAIISELIPDALGAVHCDWYCPLASAIRGTPDDVLWPIGVICLTAVSPEIHRADQQPRDAFQSLLRVHPVVRRHADFGTHFSVQQCNSMGALYIYFDRHRALAQWFDAHAAEIPLPKSP